MSEDHQIDVLKDEFNGDLSQSLQFDFCVMLIQFGILVHGLHGS